MLNQSKINFAHTVKELKVLIKVEWGIFLSPREEQGHDYAVFPIGLHANFKSHYCYRMFDCDFCWHFFKSIKNAFANQKIKTHCRVNFTFIQFVISFLIYYTGGHFIQTWKNFFLLHMIVYHPHKHIAYALDNLLNNKVCNYSRWSLTFLLLGHPSLPNRSQKLSVYIFLFIFKFHYYLSVAVTTLKIPEIFEQIVHQGLNHLFPMHPFSTPWKRQKNLRFLCFQRV